MDTAHKLSSTQLEQAYRTMVLICEFENLSVRLHGQGLMRGSIHLCNGQEAVAGGACLALREGDHLTTTYRGHGHILARGADPGRMLAEMMGRSGGLCRGKGGTMHLAEMRLGILGANGIVGAGVPLAVGAALTARTQGSDRISICFFGDGATNQGAFHEAANLAAAWRLPVVFLCENNLYAEMTPIKDTIAIEQLSQRAPGYGMPALTIDGNDVEAVYAAVGEAGARARAGAGPTFIEAMTYRQVGHYHADPGHGSYRTREEVERWKQPDRDPILRLKAVLLERAIADESRIRELEAEVAAQLRGAEAYAVASPPPAVEEALHDVYA